MIAAQSTLSVVRTLRPIFADRPFHLTGRSWTLWVNLHPYMLTVRNVRTTCSFLTPSYHKLWSSLFFFILRMQYSSSNLTMRTCQVWKSWRSSSFKTSLEVNVDEKKRVETPWLRKSFTGEVNAKSGIDGLSHIDSCGFVKDIHKLVFTSCVAW